MQFLKHSCYTRQEISEGVGGGSVHDFLPNENGRVLCACLSQEYDPSARQVVLVGAGPGVQMQGEMLCAHKSAIPVFFKQKGHLWEYAGKFVPESWTEDPDVLSEFAESSGRVNLTKVIYLKEIC